MNDTHFCKYTERLCGQMHFQIGKPITFEQ